MIRHHPSEATLLVCAASTLPMPHHSVVALHAEHCPACRASLCRGAEMGGALLDALPAVSLSEGALARAWAGLDRAPSQQPALLAPPPTSLATLARGRWLWLSPGIRLMPLVPRDKSGTRLDMIRVTPGTALPEHNHNGPELTLVLKGSFTDGIDEFHPGDVLEGDIGVHHQPLALSGENCVCLIATTGRLHARSWIARLLLPLYDL